MRQVDVRKELVSPSPGDESVSPVILAVLHDLNRRKISYCYWKSSRRISAVLSGESDLDLLVARKDQHRCETILLERGLKRFPQVPSRDDPATQSFLGYDGLTGRLFHIHLHYRLIGGARLLKNYRLPWDDAFLSRTVQHPSLPIRMLDTASEAFLLIVRACLELRRGDLVTLRHWTATARKFSADRAALAEQVDRRTLHDLAADLTNEDLAGRMVVALYDKKPLTRHWSLKRHLKNFLSPFRAYNSVEAGVRTSGRTAIWLLGGLNKNLLHLPRPWSRRAPGGGAIVAIVGLDGSGKSTLVAALRAWLGSEIDVVPMYFGTGDGRPSLLLRPFRMLVPSIKRLIRTRPKGSSHGNISDKDPGLTYSFLLTVWAIAVAREKRGKLLAARRGANRGLIVLTDRYPQNEVPEFNDGPLLDRIQHAPDWLRHLESSAYNLAQRLPPDLVIRLHITSKTAQAREPDMDPRIVRERIEALRNLDFGARRIVSINAEQPLADVIQTAKAAIWRLL